MASPASAASFTKEGAKLIIDQVEELIKTRDALRALGCATIRKLVYHQPDDPVLVLALQTQREQAFAKVDSICLEIEPLYPQYLAALEFINDPG